MNILDKIFANKREVLDAKKASGIMRELKRMSADCPPTRGFARTLVDSQHQPSLIAEVKKASPVKGMIRQDFDPHAIATAYRDAGVDCLSVLTDVEFFQGSLENLKIARHSSGLPVLRKDFTVDELDIYEARVMGADAILLIVYGLSDQQLTEYRELAELLGMDVLVEAHTEEEGERAMSAGAKLLGFNNRDLTTFETSLHVAERVIPLFAGRAHVVSESAMSCQEDIERVSSAGARSVLIGTAFCKAPDIGTKVREVMGWSM